MTKLVEADICVIGAGSAGLSVAAGASQMGARVVLVEKHLMGGDCLNYGCVPSKALLAAAHAAAGQRDSGAFGIAPAPGLADPAKVGDHVRQVIDAIAPLDSVERFEGLGVTVIQAAARFTGEREIEAGEYRVRAKRFVIATGSRPVAPPLEGLSETPYFTNETIFSHREKIDRLVIIGGGPIGLEMAQAHRRLGARVSVLDMGPILPKDDPDAAEVVRQSLVRDGVELHERVKVLRTRKNGAGVAVVFEENGTRRRILASHLLVAAGRAANIDDLDLDKAGVKHDRAIEVDARLRTGNKRIFAIGDVAGPYQFTHMAGYQAGIVIRNALFRLPAKVDYSAVPWVTFTEPELAQVGMSEAAAREKHGEIRLLRWGFHENDRAQAERETEGYAKIVTLPNGRILGATILGPQAGELIALWALAISQKMKIGAIASLILPYPTLGEVSKRAAGSFYTPKLFNERTRKTVRFLLKFG